MTQELAGAEATIFHKLTRQIASHRRRNLNLSLYADAKKRIDNTMMSIPKSMMDLAVVIGWPEKAVATPARWIKPTGYRQVGDGTIASDISAAVNDDRVPILDKMATRSSLRHGCAFMFITKGDTAAGEPEVIYSAKSALEATATMNMRTMRVDASLEVVDKKHWVLYLGDRALEIESIGSSLYVTRETRTKSPNPCVLYRWDPTLEQPFGRSRINDVVLGLTELAVRTILRLEVHGEAYAMPRRALMGAHEAAFTDKNGEPIDPLSILATAVWGIPDFFDEETGEWREPRLEQLTQGSMEPHIAALRALSGLYASETHLPKSLVGLHTENPASAEAINLESAPLADIVSDMLPYYSQARRDLAYHTMAIVHGDSQTLRKEMRKVRATFEAPGMNSVAQQMDMALKLGAALEWAKDTDTFIDILPIQEAQKEQLRNARERQTASNIARDLIDAINNRNTPQPSPPVATEPAQIEA